MFNSGENVPFFHEGKDLPVMSRNQRFVRLFVPVCLAVFHAVFFLESFNLSVPEHWKTRHGCHHGADTEILVIPAELCDRGFLVGIVHEVYVPFENFRVKFDRVFNCTPVFIVFLAFEHVHESGVVHPVHSKRTDKVTFHHPERLG